MHVPIPAVHMNTCTYRSFIQGQRSYIEVGGVKFAELRLIMALKRNETEIVSEYTKVFPRILSSR